MRLTLQGYLAALCDLAEWWATGETPVTLAGAVAADETGLINRFAR